MLSPVTGKEMTIQKEWRTMTYRKEEFRVCFHTWRCADTGEQFEDEFFAQLNYEQVQNQYRSKYAIPFRNEIISIREKYDVSAIKMSQILGFGDNTYRQYEAGEMPSQANARLIQMASEPQEFSKLVDLCVAIDDTAKEKMYRRIQHLISEQNKNKERLRIADYFFGTSHFGPFTGFKRPDMHKFAHMVLFFAEQLKPWKTKLNKLLFYADFTCFARTGYSMSGASYRAIPLGPVPNNFQGLYQVLSNEHLVIINETCLQDGCFGEKFTPANDQQFDSDLFSSTELEVLNQIADRFKETSTQDIVDISHKEKAWLDNNADKKMIDYFYAFELN